MMPVVRKRYVVIATAAAFLLIVAGQEFYGHLTSKKENILVHEPKSLIPVSQNWAQDQFQYTLTLMGKEYSTVKMWSKCNDKHTSYYENISVIFTEIPKAGSSNWLEALWKANGDIPMNQTVRINRRNFAYNRLSNQKKSYSDEVFRNAFSFTSVRNPWTRMMSGYLNKMIVPVMSRSMTDLRMQIIEEMRGITDKNMLEKLFPSFEEFAKWLSNHDGSGNEHFKPQVTMLCIPEAKYDYIVPLEYSALLSDEVLHLIGANTKFEGSYDGTTDPCVQSSAVKARKMLSDLDKDTIEKLYQIYKMDFTLMNYSNFTHPDFPLPLYKHDFFVSACDRSE